MATKGQLGHKNVSSLPTTSKEWVFFRDRKNNEKHENSKYRQLVVFFICGICCLDVLFKKTHMFDVFCFFNSDELDTTKLDKVCLFAVCFCVTLAPGK